MKTFKITVYVSKRGRLDYYPNIEFYPAVIADSAIEASAMVRKSIAARGYVGIINTIEEV